MGETTKLPLDRLHQELGGRMVPFAGYDMPVQYAAGVMTEHQHCRARAGLFDVSHMGQVRLVPKAGMESTALAFEALMPAAVLGLADGRQRYGLFTNEKGGILDDLMFANRGDDIFVVVNAACKAADIALMQNGLSDTTDVIAITDRCLLALQGPEAEAALARLVPQVADMRFMDVLEADHPEFGSLWISRSGYTGEDGFEISVAEAHSETFARALLAMDEVLPIGLGARDSLRLEAGLCLYGHDIDETTSPVEAGLGWSIQKSRRRGGDREGGFPGADRILAEMETGARRTRVALRPEGRAPMREATPLLHEGREIGRVTSGGFGPSVGAPIAMGYVPTELAAPGTALTGQVRGKDLPVTTTTFPFHPHSFKR
jgi:aminomethyltransferase